MSEIRSRLTALACVAVSAAAFYTATGLGRLWPAAWIAPLPVLWLALRVGHGAAFFCASAAWFAGSLNLFSYLARIIPAPILILVLAIPALLFGICILAAKFVAARVGSWIAVFAFPAAWTSIEFLVSRVSPHGTALSLAYSQADFLPILQAASVTGIWGITFLLTLMPAACALAWTSRRVLWLAPALVPAALALAYGLYRLEQPPGKPQIRIGLAATSDAELEAVFETTDAATATAVARGYADRIARLARRGAQVIVLPEKIVGVAPQYADAVAGILGNAAGNAGVTLVAGVNRVGTDPLRNVALVFAGDGRVSLEYEKHHLLPGPESGYAIGTHPGLFPGPGGRWGVAICKDMDFPNWLRGYGREGINFLAVPAWDFVVDGRLHSRMAVVRGVENGFAVARSAQQGLLGLSDAYGRTIAEHRTERSAETLLVANLGAGPGRTLYSRMGDWLGWASVAFIAVLLGAAIAWPPQRRR